GRPFCWAGNGAVGGRSGANRGNVGGGGGGGGAPVTGDVAHFGDRIIDQIAEIIRVAAAGDDVAHSPVGIARHGDQLVTGQTLGDH
ncbi:hypothetical protein ABTN18_20060, partial [Acinetobacter baumannii]